MLTVIIVSRWSSNAVAVAVAQLDVLDLETVLHTCQPNFLPAVFVDRINLLRSPCAYPRSKTAGYYSAEKQNWRATLKIKIALSTRQEREEYEFKQGAAICRIFAAPRADTLANAAHAPCSCGSVLTTRFTSLRSPTF